MTDYVLYPAIDVREGRVVRLRQGDYAQETRYADDPLALAARFFRAANLVSSKLSRSAVAVFRCWSRGSAPWAPRVSRAVMTME